MYIKFNSLNNTLIHADFEMLIDYFVVNFNTLFAKILDVETFRIDQKLCENTFGQSHHRRRHLQTALQSDFRDFDGQHYFDNTKTIYRRTHKMHI